MFGPGGGGKVLHDKLPIRRMCETDDAGCIGPSEGGTLLIYPHPSPEPSIRLRVPQHGQFPPLSNGSSSAIAISLSVCAEVHSLYPYV